MDRGRAWQSWEHSGLSHLDLDYPIDACSSLTFVLVAQSSTRNCSMHDIADRDDSHVRSIRTSHDPFMSWDIVPRLLLPSDQSSAGDEKQTRAKRSFWRPWKAEQSAMLCIRALMSVCKCSSFPTPPCCQPLRGDAAARMQVVLENGRSCATKLLMWQLVQGGKLSC